MVQFLSQDLGTGMAVEFPGMLWRPDFRSGLMVLLLLQDLQVRMAVECHQPVERLSCLKLDCQATTSCHGASVSTLWGY
jgi:hypothetical protein